MCHGSKVIQMKGFLVGLLVYQDVLRSFINIGWLDLVGLFCLVGFRMFQLKFSHLVFPAALANAVEHLREAQSCLNGKVRDKRLAV